MEKSDLERIVRGEFSPELFAELMEIYPDIARGAHIKLAHRNPELYRIIVPDIFDEQTGLFSKGYFEGALLDESIRSANEHGSVFCYGILDLDNFHGINEEYGHQGGDAAIHSVSQILLRNLRTHERRRAEPSELQKVLDNRRVDRRGRTAFDLLGYSSGRVGGGEEFGLILPGCSYRDAFNVMDRIRRDVEHLVIYQGGQGSFKVTTSGGFTQYSPKMFKEELIEHADYALQEAKKHPGKNIIIGHL